MDIRTLHFGYSSRKRKKTSYLQFFFPQRALLCYGCLALTVFLFSSCATIGYPEGGPVDTTSPKLIKSLPENESTLFSSKKIELFFDEVVILKDFSSQFICSPPLEKLPEYSLSDKKITIQFQEKLKENTSYRLQFGNSIVDNTEGNALLNFTYIFSTSDSIDQMTLFGKVIDAYTGEPSSNFWVNLYSIDQDSIVTTERPLYISRTNQAGEFTFHNLRKGQYKIIALNDLNSNLLYDLKTESIGFLSEMQTSYPSKLPDEGAEEEETQPDPIVLVSFLEEDSTQQILSSDFLSKQIFRLVTKYPVEQPHFLNLNEKTLWEQNVTKDSLFFWLPVDQTEHISFILKDGETTLDTIEENYIAPTSTSVKSEPLIKTNFSGKLAFFEKPTFIFSNPILDSFEIGNIQLISEEDTLYPSCRIDTKNERRRAYLDFEFKEGKTYIVNILPSAFISIYGDTNEAISFNSTLSKKSDYGNFLFGFKGNPGNSYLIELIESSTKNVIKKERIEESSRLLFENLLPGEYKVRVVEDTDRNSRWTSGNYWMKIQPEKVHLFSKPIQIRANWDLEEEMDWSEYE